MRASREGEISHLEKKLKTVAIGWQLEESSKNCFTQNLLEYYYVSLYGFNAHQYISYSTESLKEQSINDGFKQIIIIKQGIMFQSLNNALVQALESDNSVITIKGQKTIEMSNNNIIDLNDNNTDNISWLTEQLNLQVSFIANTEKFMYEPVDGQIFTKLITSSGGLNPILYPWSLKMTAGATVDVVDLSNIALVNARRWVTEWDGNDCIQFANKLNSFFEVDNSPSFITRGGSNRHKQRMQELVETQVGFNNWYANDFPSIKYNFKKHDFFNSINNDALIEDIKNNEGNVYIHLSNIYHYQPTAFYYNLADRISMQNNFIKKLKLNNLGNRVMLTFIDAQHQMPPVPTWVDDIELNELLPRYKVFPWQ